MSIFSSIFAFIKQLFEKKWDGAESFLAMLKMPDKRQHHLFAYGLGAIILGLMWVSMTQEIFHPLSAGVFLVGTFFLFADEFGQFLHNNSLAASGQTPDRGISIWDIAAGWLSIVVLSATVEIYYNSFKSVERIIELIQALQ